jgi:hypothetical protein
VKAIEAAKLVAMLAAAYRDTKISAETSRVYETMLADLELETAKAAVARLIATSKWLPTIAEIRSTAADVERGPVRTGGEAWGDVLAEIRRTGYIGAPSFRDPVVTDCVHMMTWRGLCLGENEAADRARFIELYENLAQRRRDDVVAGRELPTPRGGLGLPSPVGNLMRALPARLTGKTTEVPQLPAPSFVPGPFAGKRMSADELEAELAKVGKS